MAERQPVQMHPVQRHRVYEHERAEGHKVLVDRLWPRGISKADEPWDEWSKEVAPSTELRKWYGHDVERWDEFVRRYHAELAEPPASEALAHLRELAASGGLALLTATRDVEHSAAQVLAEELAGEG